MGKQSRTIKGPRALDASDAKIGSIGTWQDVADEEDECMFLFFFLSFLFSSQFCDTGKRMRGGERGMRAHG